MKVRQLLYLAWVVVMITPMVTNAQVYKWKDGKGNINYADTPPPNIETKTIGKEKPQRQPTANAEQSASEPVKKRQAQIKKEKLKEVVGPEQEAARLRQRNAEIEQKNKIEKEAQAKRNAENCKAAKANYQMFAQGGRVYTTNEHGDREYMNGNDLTAGKKKAQNEINQYCQ